MYSLKDYSNLNFLSLVLVDSAVTQFSTIGPSVAERIGVDPDLSETDGGVEAEEDDERNTKMSDDAPRQLSVEPSVHRHVVCLLHLTAK